jgi:hypothetical protein
MYLHTGVDAELQVTTGTKTIADEISDPAESPTGRHA